MKDGESGADVYDRVSVFFETMYRDFDKPEYTDCYAWHDITYFLNALVITGQLRSMKAYKILIIVRLS